MSALPERARLRAAYLTNHDPRTTNLLIELAEHIQFIEDTKE